MFEIIPKPLNLTVTPPPSKSFLHRALICAFLSESPCEIENIYFSKDIEATYNILNSVKKNKKAKLNAYESGSTLRFLIPVLSALYEENHFIFSSSLGSRPLEEYFKIFRQQNIYYKKDSENLIIKGRLKPDTFYIDCSLSSQFITGLLLICPLLDGNSEIIITGDIISLSYINITLDVLKSFGVKIHTDKNRFIIKGNQKYYCPRYKAEADWSSGAFWHFMKTKHNIKILGLNENSLQGDRVALDIIKDFPSVISCKNCPDIVPCLVAYSISINKKIIIKDCNRLKYKESDRLFALNEFKKLGADIICEDDCIRVGNRHSLKSGFLRSFNDHRILMAYILFAYLTGITVTCDSMNPISKSYPTLPDILK